MSHELNESININTHTYTHEQMLSLIDALKSSRDAMRARVNDDANDLNARFTLNAIASLIDDIMKHALYQHYNIDDSFDVDLIMHVRTQRDEFAQITIDDAIASLNVHDIEIDDDDDDDETQSMQFFDTHRDTIVRVARNIQRFNVKFEQTREFAHDYLCKYENYIRFCVDTTTKSRIVDIAQSINTLRMFTRACVYDAQSNDERCMLRRDAIDAIETIENVCHNENAFSFALYNDATKHTQSITHTINIVRTFIAMHDASHEIDDTIDDDVDDDVAIEIMRHARELSQRMTFDE